MCEMGLELENLLSMCFRALFPLYRVGGVDEEGSRMSPPFVVAQDL